MRNRPILLLSLIIMACQNIDIPQIMETYLWEKRVIILFTPNTQNADYVAQKETLDNNQDGLLERDVIIIDVVDFNFVSFNGEKQPHIATKHFYQAYNVPADRFSLILLGKDGEEKLRRDQTVPMQELFGIIDAMPMRQREINSN